MSLDELRSSLERELPPVFSREVAEAKTGRLVTAVRLRDLDSAGEGPLGRVRIGGKKVGYQRGPFVEWFMGRVKSLDVGI